MSDFPPAARPAESNSASIFRVCFVGTLVTAALQGPNMEERLKPRNRHGTVARRAPRKVAPRKFSRGCSGGRAFVRILAKSRLMPCVGQCRPKLANISVAHLHFCRCWPNFGRCLTLAHLSWDFGRLGPIWAKHMASIGQCLWTLVRFRPTLANIGHHKAQIGQKGLTRSNFWTCGQL